MTQTATPPEAPPRPAAPPAPDSPAAAGYGRVDVDRVDRGAPGAPGAGDVATPARGAAMDVRWVVIPLSVLLCVIQAVASIFFCDTRDMMPTCTLIPLIALAVMFVIVLGVNPVMRLVARVLGNWCRPLNRVELICVFAAMSVTAGISTFGLTEQLIPLLVAPHYSEWDVPQRGWEQQLIPSLNPHLYIQDRNVIEEYRQGIGIVKNDDGSRLVAPRDSDGWLAYGAYCWAVCRAVPWGAWVPPLAYWLVFVGGCYGIFYSITYVVLGYWSDREKLIFPLARLAESVLPDAAAHGPTPALAAAPPRHAIPALFRSPGFWLGFLISFAVLGWNGTTGSGLLTGLSPVPMGMSSRRITDVLSGSIFAGLGGNSLFALMFLIIFTAIGISFLLPLEISFSIWFYYLVGRAILLILIWSGRGQSVSAFPSDWLWISNPVSALGGGGIFLFSGVSLFRCLRDYLRLIRGRSFRDSIVIALPAVGLAASMTVVSFWIAWNRVPILWAFLFVFCLTLLTIGLMRLVAEGGIYWFQSHTSFFHVYKMLGLGRWLAPALIAPLLPIYSVLFLDIKTFLAPNLLDSAEMYKNAAGGGGGKGGDSGASGGSGGSGGNRAKFHLNIVLCIVVSVAVSLAFAIVLAHIRGGQSLEGWFHNAWPPMLMDTAQRAITDPPQFDLSTTLWYAGGALWVALSIFLRTTLFWFPHPVGLIMLINPLNTQLWFSFFVGWVCKKLVVRYGGKATFDKVRLIFIGLILGEIMAILFWTAMTLIIPVHAASVTLNRYGS